MSKPAPDLSDLLTDIPRAGVRPLPPDSSARIAAAAAQVNQACLRVSLNGCQDKTELLQRFATAFAFPDWFGHNWDALADCLGDLEWMPTHGYVLLLEHAADFRATHPEEFDTLLDVLRDTSRQWAADGLPFWVFVDLGPNAH